MSAFALYVVGFVLVVAGVLYAEHLLHVPQTWVIVSALVMLGLASGIALLLGIVGLYGVIAYSATQRTREIGIRIALGAQRNAIVRMFVRQGLAMSCIGVAIGLLAALGVTQLMKSFLFGVSATDPLTFALVPAGLLLTAAAASWLPSRGAASIDPVEAIRCE